MKKLHPHLAVLVAFLLAPAITHAEQNLTVPEIMEFTTAKSANYKTWSADYLQTMTVMGSQITVNGRMIQKEPRKMWARLDMPAMGQQGQITMYMSDDGILWQIMEMGGRSQIMKMNLNSIMSSTASAVGAKGDPLAQLDARQWETSKQLYDFQLADSRSIDSQPMYVLDGTWKESARTNQLLAATARMIGRTRFFIGQRDGFLHRLEQYDATATNQVMAMEFKNLKFNEDVPDATFLYKPPADAQVLDMTAMMETQMRGATQPPAPK